jgi:hypothetical protein
MVENPIQDSADGIMPHSITRNVPLSLKLSFTIFMAILVPVYASTYGPANFLYFCDLALFLTLIGIWREDRLLISMSAVGILAPQCLWLVDYAAHFAGATITGMTDYMFDDNKSMFLRSLSLFHGWLPLLLIFLVSRLGYDRRAFALWTGLGSAVMLLCYTVMPPPRPDPGNAAVNINYVFGLSDTAPQSWMPPLAWLGLLMAGFPAVFYAPAHFLLSRAWNAQRDQGKSG